MPNSITSSEPRVSTKSFLWVVAILLLIVAIPSLVIFKVMQGGFEADRIRRIQEMLSVAPEKEAERHIQKKTYVLYGIGRVYKRQIPGVLNLTEERKKDFKILYYDTKKGDDKEVGKLLKRFEQHARVHNEIVFNHYIKENSSH